MSTPKRPRDVNELARRVVDIATGETPDESAPEKDEGAARLGAKGGASRAARMTSEERKDAARKAAEGRWRKPRG